jgi:hypothetical protein
LPASDIGRASLEKLGSEIGDSFERKGEGELYIETRTGQECGGSLGGRGRNGADPDANYGVVCVCVAGDRRNRRRGREGGCYFRGVRWRDEGLFVSGHQPLANCHVINPRGQGAKITARVTTRPGEAAASANRIELHLFSVFDSALSTCTCHAFFC